MRFSAFKQRPGSHIKTLTVAGQGLKARTSWVTSRCSATSSPRPWWGPTASPSGWSGSRPSATSAGSARPTWPRSTRSRSRPRSRTRSRPGIDIVSDGELRRDNDIDYFLARIPGVLIERRAKADYYDYFEAEVAAELPEDEQGVTRPGRRLLVHVAADRPAGEVLLHRAVLAVAADLRASAYRDPADLVRALARRLNLEAQVAGGRRAPGSCRSTSRSWRATRSRPSSRWRR